MAFYDVYYDIPEFTKPGPCLSDRPVLWDLNNYHSRLWSRIPHTATTSCPSNMHENHVCHHVGLHSRLAEDSRQARVRLGRQGLRSARVVGPLCLQMAQRHTFLLFLFLGSCSITIKPQTYILFSRGLLNSLVSELPFGRVQFRSL